ncbi:MAG: T9SS type A sorting domain-containing protein [bacterium]|nr:T9SS type A sorting domain-containing protein [bacterium]
MEKNSLLTFFDVLLRKINSCFLSENTISTLGLKIPSLFYFNPQSQKTDLTKRYSHNNVSKSGFGGFFFSFVNMMLFLLICFLFFSAQINAQVLPGIATVNTPTGGFQIEGDLQANTPISGKGDWLPGVSGSGGSVLTAAGTPVNALTTFHLTDLYNTSENNFSGGKKFNDNPNLWTWTSNSALGKCDINNALFHFTTAPYTDPVTHVNSIHTWLIVAADRRSNSGNAYIDFELLQNTMTDNPNGTFSSAGPNNGRTKGDILLTLALTNGGGAAEFFVNKWDLVGGIYDYVDKTSSTPAGSVYASTNAGNVPVSFSAFGLNQYSSNLFVEAAIDLTALLGAIDPCTSLGVKTLFIKTKTSQSPTATIVDFINAKQVSLQIGLANAGLDQSQCGSVFSVTGTATPSPGDAISSTTWSVFSGTATIASPSLATSNITVTGSSATLRYTVNTIRGCTVYDDVVLEVLTPPTANAGSDVTINCTTTSTTLGASGGVSYSWSPATGLSATNIANPVATPATTTTYTVTVTGANGCTKTDSVIVTVDKALPLAPVVCVVQPSLCGPTTGSVTILNPIGFDYVYSIDNGTTWQAATVFSSLAPGSVTGIKVKKLSSGCISDPADCSASNCPTPSLAKIANPDTKTTETIAPIETTLTAKTANSGFDAYPVPFKDQLTIKYKFDYVSDVKIEVFNAQGISIFSKMDTNSYLNKEIALDLKLSRGKEQVYIVKLTTNRGSSVKKVMSSK